MLSIYLAREISTVCLSQFDLNVLYMNIIIGIVVIINFILFSVSIPFLRIFILFILACRLNPSLHSVLLLDEYIVPR